MPFVKRYFLSFINLQSVLSGASLPHLVIMENNAKEVVQESNKAMLQFYNKTNFNSITDARIDSCKEKISKGSNDPPTNEAFEPNVFEQICRQECGMLALRSIPMP